jgi:hypothetical protein
MAFSQEDLAALGGFIGDQIDKRFAAQDAKQAVQAQQTRDSIVGVPDVDPDAGPTYYIHLANGAVVESKDSVSTHLPNPDNESEPILVVNRFQKGE